jgi:hypothetical protein
LEEKKQPIMKEFAETFFEEISDELENSIIFAEKDFILSIKFNELFQKFLTSGGITIIDLSGRIDYDFLKTSDYKIFIFIKEFNETNQKILQNIQNFYNLKDVVVFSSQSNYSLKQLNSMNNFKEIKKFFHELNCDA